MLLVYFLNLLATDSNLTLITRFLPQASPPPASRPPRFYVPDPLSTCTDGSIVQLPLTEALHASRTLRMKEGDALEVCDGKGCTAAAEWLNSQNKTGSLVRLTSEVIENSREPWEWTVAVACGSLKGGRGDWLVEKAAELGAAKLLPLLTTRSPTIAGSDRNSTSSSPGSGSKNGGWKGNKPNKKRGDNTDSSGGGGGGVDAAAGGREGRWHRVSLAAMKQCLRPRAMEIHAPCTIQDLCSKHLSIDTTTAINGADIIEEGQEIKTTVAWVGTEGAPPIEQRAQELLNSLQGHKDGLSIQKPRQGVLIIGPEGDFTLEELDIMVTAGVQGVGLGPLRLRTETAAIAMLSYARLMVTI